MLATTRVAQAQGFYIKHRMAHIAPPPAAHAHLAEQLGRLLQQRNGYMRCLIGQARRGKKARRAAADDYYVLWVNRHCEGSVWF